MQIISSYLSSRSITRAIFMLIFGMSSVFSQLAFAEPDYQVEVIIFSNTDPSTLDDEYWETTLDVKGPSRTTRLYSSQSQASDFIEVNTAQRQLNDEARRLANSRNHKVLYHKAWQQKVTGERDARAVYVAAGNLLDNGMYELEGYITIDRGRYLHFKPNLFFSKHLNSYESTLVKRAPQPEPEQTSPSSLSDADYTSTQYSDTSNQQIGIEVPEFVAAQLNQGRRMRSNETHYVDHPLFGAIIRVIPIK